MNEIDPQNLEVIKFDGKINYFTTFLECAAVCDDILRLVDLSNDLFIMGFDIEWPFNFKTGSLRTSVIQMAYSLQECHVFHVTNIKNLPLSMTELLSNPKVRLVGVNIRNDIRKLSKDFCGIKVDEVQNNCIDLSQLANSVIAAPLQRRWSLQNLIIHFLNMNMDKDKKVRVSKWNVLPLNSRQLVYAATDAYASLKLYYHLRKLMVKIENEPKTEMQPTVK